VATQVREVRERRAHQKIPGETDNEEAENVCQFQVDRRETEADIPVSFTVPNNGLLIFFTAY
jgi:hypothetical protein